MKIGSVRFFKVLIVSVYLLLIIVPLVLAIVFGVLYAGERKRANELEAAGAPVPLANHVQLQSNGPAASLPAEARDVSESGQPAVPPSFAYQALYPELYAEPAARVTEETGVCYLTFDDGPSLVTRQILDTLAQRDIKATFFVTGEASEKNEELLKAMAEAGHTIGVHSYSHDYEAIYASVEAFLADFEKMYGTIERITGQKPTIFRFPGGSINVYNREVYTAIVAEMTRRGFVFFDWNTAGSDAVRGGIGKQEIINNVLASSIGLDRAVVLLHDRADNLSTSAALPGIIEGLTARGYHFAPLTSGVRPVTYTYSG